MYKNVNIYSKRNGKYMKKRIIVVVVSSIVLCLCLFFIFQIEKDTSKMAYQIKKNAGHVKTGIKTKICFYFMRMLHTRGWDEADLAYWSKKGWDREKRPWKNNKGV